MTKTNLFYEKYKRINKMNKYNITGATILVLFFFGIVAVMAQSMGWSLAIGGFIFAIIATVILMFACYLLTK